MKCKVTCSFGEIVDKITILKIKQGKALEIGNTECLQNINNELKILEQENPLAKEVDPLFQTLSAINNELWVLEDNIREKSQKKEFDNEYIEYAELIHKTNDKRCETKRVINMKYGSLIVEEKIYNNAKFLNE